jgi:hypothetical protein
MQIPVESIEKLLEEEEQILSTIRCSINVYHYSKVPRPGLLAATTVRLIFVSDANVEGGEYTELFPYQNVHTFNLEKRLFTKRFYLKVEGDQFTFNQIMDEEPGKFAQTVNQRL